MIKTLPFNHNSENFYEAIGIPSEKIKEIFENPSKFDSLSSEEKLRITVCLGLFLMRTIINFFPDIISLFFALSYDKDKFSHLVEIIEKNLLKLIKEKNLSFEYILKIIFESTVYCINSVGAAVLITQAFIDNLKFSEEILIH